MASSTDTALYPTLPARPIERVAILFAGGPAPAANAVISTAAASFRRNRHRSPGHHARLRPS